MDKRYADCLHDQKNGRDGKKGQPWSIITHLLYKNIFLETYENPQTAEELALELGIALPYMEDELEFLTREQLLTKNENKYQTAFKIISKEEQRKKYDNNKKIQKPMTDKICELIDTYIIEDDFDSEFSGLTKREDTVFSLSKFQRFCKNNV